MNMLHFIMWSDAETKRRNAEETIKELQQRIDKAIEYVTDEMRIVNDNEYHRLLEILKGDNNGN